MFSTWTLTLLMRCAAAAVLLIALTGCGTSKPIQLWKDRVETYVENQGNGDLTVLRNTDPGASVTVFGANSGSMEAQGQLVGIATIDDQQWWTYIIGVTKKDDLTGTRAVAVAIVDDEVVFRQSTEDEAATQRYRESRFKQWSINRLSPVEDGAFICGFPGPNDSFTLSVSGMTATIHERQSGARWFVTLIPEEGDDDTQSAAHASAGR